MEKQDIALLQQIHKTKVTWNQETIDRALSLQDEKYIKYCAAQHAGQWEVTKKGVKFL